MVEPKKLSDITILILTEVVENIKGIIWPMDKCLHPPGCKSVHLLITSVKKKVSISMS